MSPRTFPATGIVLKRINTGETDRIITILTPEQGKFRCIAKGVRKTSSTLRSSIEPGSIVKALFINTKTMPIITQARTVDSCQNIYSNLTKLRQLSQILEIFDHLFVEEEIDPPTFTQILRLRQTILSEDENINGKLRAQLEKLIAILGFARLDETPYESITEYVSAITERPLNSFEFLMVK